MKRIKAIIADGRYQEYIGQINEYEQNRKHCRHNWEHFLAVCRIGYILLLEENNLLHIYQKLNLDPKGQSAIKELVYAAGLLHDIGRWREYETGEDHALVSGELAIPILRDADFSEQEILLIVTAIKEHRGLGGKESYLGEVIGKADNFARSCQNCEAKSDCYKIKKMPWFKGDNIY